MAVHQLLETPPLRLAVERVLYVRDHYRIIRCWPDMDSREALKELDFDRHAKYVTVAGHLPEVLPGDWLEGRFLVVVHAKYGRQLEPIQVGIEPENAEQHLHEGTWQFLAAQLKGIGKLTAKRLLEHYGLGVIEQLEQGNLLEVLPARLEQDARASWPESRELYYQLQPLFELGLSYRRAKRLAAYFEHNPEFRESVRQNIYLLSYRVRGYGFRTTDHIAIRKLDYDHDDPRRLEAAAVYSALAASGDGHTCTSLPELIKRAVRETQLEEEQIKTGISIALGNGLLTQTSKLIGPSILFQAEARLITRVIPELLAFARCHSPEHRQLAQAILEQAVPAAATELPPLELQPPDDLQLSDEQRRVFELLEKHRITMVTGGPGTGKTYLIGSLAKALDLAKKSFALAALPGKAARRMEESSGYDATTIHSLLSRMKQEQDKDEKTNIIDILDQDEYDWDPYRAASTLSFDLLIIDEASMIDTALMASLLNSLSADTRILLVGDIDQLPPVGPGQPFREMLELRPEATVRLNQIFRQRHDSPIVRVAHAVRRRDSSWMDRSSSWVGRDYHSEKDGFTHIDLEDPREIRSEVYGAYTRLRIDTKERPQVITPYNAGPLGASALNRMLQDLGDNPSGQTVSVGNGELAIPGDLLIATANNRSLGLANGDQGYLYDIDEHYRSLTFLHLDGDQVEIPKKYFDIFRLAYAITVHRALGSEWERVIVVMHTMHYALLNRPLLYTAITRPKTSCVVIGPAAALRMALETAGVHRSTWFSRLAQVSRAEGGLNSFEDIVSQGLEEPPIEAGG